MSADLFAEFNSLSNNAPPPSAQSQPQSQPPPSSDPFDFFSTSSHAASISPQKSQPTQSWSTFQSQPANTSAWGNFSAPLAPSAPVASLKPSAGNEDDDDGWGDFEMAEPMSSTSASVQSPAIISPSPSMNWQSTSQALAPQPANAQVPVRNRIVRASTLDLLSNNLLHVGTAPEQPAGTAWGGQAGQKSQPPTIHETPPQSHPKPKLKSGSTDASVLFDAEDFELQIPEGEEEDDDDEFGDFESGSVVPAPIVKSAPPPIKTSSNLPSMDLLSLDDPAPPLPNPVKEKSHPSQLLGTLAFGSTTGSYPQAPKSPSFQDRNPFPDLAIKTPTGPQPQNDKPKSASPITAWPTFEKTVETQDTMYKDEDDSWGAWDESPANDTKKIDIDSTKPPESWDWDAVDNVKPMKSPEPPKPSESVKSPSNDLGEDAPPPINVPPPSVILSIFPDLLNTGEALFKPISGQSTSIKERILSDPKAVDFLEGYVLLAATAARVIAGRKQRWHRDKILAKSMSISAAGSKGMKLAGVDKTQAAREDREAADVAAVWKGQVGRLRSAVAAAKTTGKASTLRVPEISETMQVQTAKMVPTSAKACIICGLKREERVAKVDYDIEDSFGEWWAEHWGHKACKNFWIQHEKMLRQR